MVDSTNDFGDGIQFVFQDVELKLQDTIRGFRGAFGFMNAIAHCVPRHLTLIERLNCCISPLCCITAHLSGQKVHEYQKRDDSPEYLRTG